MKKYYLAFVIPLLINNLLGNTITVSGNIVDSITLKSIPNVNVITDKGGTNSNSLGEFDLESMIMKIETKNKDSSFNRLFWEDPFFDTFSQRTKAKIFNLSIKNSFF